MLASGGAFLVTAAAVFGAAPVVEVSKSAVTWQGSRVVGLDAGRLGAGELEGLVVRRLDEVARPVFRAAREAMRGVGEIVTAEMRAEPGVAWGVVARAMVTLELAGADRVHVEGIGRGCGSGSGGGCGSGCGHAGDGGLVSVSKVIVKSLARHRGIKWSAYPTIWLTRRGYAVYTHPSGRIAQHLKATGREWIGALRSIREVFSSEQNLAIMAEDAISFREMLKVRACARALGFSQAVFRPGLFR